MCIRDSVTPNIALLPRLRELQYDIHYIGSYNGMEKQLVEQQGIPYHGISSGKLRRYFSLQNFTDPFRVLKGFSEANRLIKQLKPDVIFSKGGFVSVPVVIAGKKNHVPVIIHESDMTPGLANKLSIPSAAKVCCNFPETLSSLPQDKEMCIRDSRSQSSGISGLILRLISSVSRLFLVSRSLTELENVASP